MLLGLLTALGTQPGCDGADALVLSVRPPPGVTLKQYAIQVQDRESRTIIYSSGVQPVDAVAKGRDLATDPLRVGLKLSRGGSYLIHVRAATGLLAPDGVTPKTRSSEWFFATLARVGGTTEVEAPLLEVDPMYDRDFDHFPDSVTWLDAVPDARARYGSQIEVLDCIDRDPLPSEMPLPVRASAREINPLAKPKCGLPIDLACGPVPPACADNDKDGDPEGSDCDDSDPNRFHGNLRPRNCCECTDRASCATNHAKRSDLSVCEPARCDSQTDFDCTGVVVPCFIDEDCDGYAANDPVPSQRDCDDKNADVHPGASKHCDDPSKDWACDGNPRGGCVPCDLDGDGYQRVNAARGCPDKFDTHPGLVDCDDNDRGVFPGSSGYEGSTLLIRDLTNQEGGGSVAAAMRGLCRNRAPDPTKPTDSIISQDSDCDGNARKGCPTAACDADGDGFPVNKAGCTGFGIAFDCDDTKGDYFPGAPDVCGDGKAQNCLSDRPCMVDSDKDGYDSDVDCDDNNAAVHPFAPELCNGKDDDCDGLIDELNPDGTGAPLIGTTIGTGNVMHTGILSCTDNNLGQCGNKLSTGAFTGRCVCSGVAPISGTRDPNVVRQACPGTRDDETVAPKCFSATQPSSQTCVAGQDTDEDCDGRIDAPDGIRLAEYGQGCGTTGATPLSGVCKSGKVNGCKKTGYVSPFSVSSGFNIVPAFDEKRKFLTCDNTAVYPSADSCDGKDNDCNNVVDDCKLTGAGKKPACCGSIPQCLDLNTDSDHCGDCNTICDPSTGPNCVVGKCQCGTNAKCSGATPLCRTADSKCVQCLDDGACAGVPGKTHCLNQDSCVECTADAQCGGGKKCHPTLHACVECVNDGNCASGQCDTTKNMCVACVTDGYCMTASPATPVCKVAVPKCVQCVNSGQCISGNNRVCDSDLCVECAASANCTFDATKKACDTMAKTCVACLADQDCTYDALKKVCDPAAKACFECYSNGAAGKTECAKYADPTKVVCDDANKKCVGCLADGDCTVDATKKICDKDATKKCYECISAGMAGKDECALYGDANKVVCDDTNKKCVRCLANADCPAAKPSCEKVTTKQCYECYTAGAAGAAQCALLMDAAKVVCDATNKKCVECLSNADCTAPATCNMATNKCM